MSESTREILQEINEKLTEVIELLRHLAAGVDAR